MASIEWWRKADKALPDPLRFPKGSPRLYKRALASSKQGEGYGWRVKAQRIGDHKGKVRERAR